MVPPTLSTTGSVGTASASTSVPPARASSCRRVTSKGGRAQSADVRRAKSRNSRRISRASSDSAALEEDMNNEVTINELLQKLQNESNSTLTAIQKEHADCLSFTLASISQFFSAGIDETGKELEELTGKLFQFLPVPYFTDLQRRASCC